MKAASDIELFVEVMEWCNGGRVALLRAYFDESEHAGLLCVAGFAFAPQQAVKLAHEFKAAFGEYGGFHMVDLVAKRGGYCGISNELRDDLVKRAVKIVKKRFSYGVAATVRLDEFNRGTPKWIRGFGHAYPFLCHVVMVALVKVSKDHDDESPITYIFEDGHAHESEAQDFVKTAASRELREFYRYRGHAFLAKADAIPLQAADLLAWEMRKFKDETIDKSQRNMRLSLQHLCRGATKRIQLAFCSGDKLTAAFERYRDLGLQQIAEGTN